MTKDKEAGRSRWKDWYYKNIERARELKRVNMRKLRAERREHYNGQSRQAKAKQRKKLLDIYGHQCSRCGFSDERALTLDHVKNNGAQERREIGERGVYLRALKPDHREDYRILCMNCQFIKRVEAGRSNQHKAK